MYSETKEALMIVGASFLWACALTQPTVSKHWRNGDKYWLL